MTGLILPLAIVGYLILGLIDLRLDRLSRRALVIALVISMSGCLKLKGSSASGVTLPERCADLGWEWTDKGCVLPEGAP